MDLNEAYDKINLYFPKINREMVDNIVLRFSDIADIYLSHIGFNDKELNKVNNSLLIKRILNNKTCNTPSSTNTVLSFVTSMCKFVYWYNKEPLKLCEHPYIWNFIACNVHEFDFKKKIFDPSKMKYVYERDLWIINDRDLDEVYKEFMDIDFGHLMSFRSGILKDP